MFIGHFGVALAAGSSRKSPSLGTLFAASQLIDLGFFSLMLAGVEKMRFVSGATVMNPMDLYFMPYTHGLVGSMIWAVAFGALVWIGSRRIAAAAIAAGVVFSHWLLDLLTHKPDLLLPDGSFAGLGLWNHPAIEMPLEIGATLVGLLLYARATAAAKPSGRWSLWALLVLLLAMQAINWFAPTPEVVGPGVAIQALAAYVVAIAVAAWAASTRRFRAGAGADSPTPI